MDAVLVTTAGLLLLLAAAWSMLLAVRRRWPAGWLSDPLEHPALTYLAPDEIEDDGDDDEEDGGVGVREPRRPLPSTGGAAAYADPDERAA